jgi:dynein heavy chain
MENSFLWMDSLEETFKSFVEENGEDLVKDFAEEGVPFNQIMSMIGVDLGCPIPSLEKFDAQIDRFNKLKQQLSGMKTPADIHWLRINAQPVKMALVGFAQEWEQKYSSFLHTFCEERISQVDNFITGAIKGFTENSPADHPEDEKLLYATMTNIRDVKLSTNAMKLLFKPLGDQCNMLKKHGIFVDEQKLQILDQAPAKWEEVGRASFDEKEKILVLQNQESLKIRKKIDLFADDVSKFREDFLVNAPFQSASAESREYDQAYDAINNYHEKTMTVLDKSKEYNNLELLFDIQPSNYRALKDSLDDLVHLKNLWDAIILIKETFLDWNDTLWDSINTDDLLMRVKDLATQAKVLPKGMRGWKLYNWLLKRSKI